MNVLSRIHKLLWGEKFFCCRKPILEILNFLSRYYYNFYSARLSNQDYFQFYLPHLKDLFGRMYTLTPHNLPLLPLLFSVHRGNLLSYFRLRLFSFCAILLWPISFCTRSQKNWEFTFLEAFSRRSFQPSQPPPFLLVSWCSYFCFFSR